LNYRRSAYIGIILILSFLLSCSTEKNTPTSRAYHEITTKYNILFNGNESFKKGITALKQSYQDDYNEVLPVFLYGDEKLVGTISSDMDRTIKKCTKIISLHSITAKPEQKDDENLSDKKREFYNKNEFNKWMDDVYLLLGKAHFYKHEYKMAKETFVYMLSEFKNEPITYNARIWMARIANEEKDFKNSNGLLTELQKVQNFPDHLKPELNTTWADYYIKQQEYPSAIPYLEKAVNEVKDKSSKIRYTFILAQLNVIAGNMSKASDLYKQVIKLNPPYEMTFHARINRALTYESGSGSAKKIEDELKKMLRDDKNIEYQDQIYYALGNLSYKQGKMEEALGNYKSSVNHSTNNTAQKARTYLTMADIYYGRPDYINAQAYYDSAVSILDMNYPNYDLIYAKSTNLTQLVKEINTVSREDSLLRLANMDSTQLLSFVDNIISGVRAKEMEDIRLKQNALMKQQSDRVLTSNTGPTVAGEGNTNWYFYNPTAKNLGRKDFQAKWGNRKLEDNWRRKNKNTVSFGAAPTADVQPAQGQNIQDNSSITDNKSRAFYLQYIPFSDSAKIASNEKIQQALFNAGLIYKNDLKDYEKSVKEFEELIRRYPNTPLKLNTYYNLYSAFLFLKDKAKVEYYKNALIREFPESTYAKVLINPDYVKQIETEQNKAEKYYNETFSLFRNQNYAEVITRTDYALKNFNDADLLPKFEYMHTVSVGKSQEVDMFRKQLLKLVSKYPKTGVADNAKILIRYLDNQHPEVKEQEVQKAAEILYQIGDSVEHYFAFVIPKNVNINQLLFNIINFNLDNFPDKKLTQVKGRLNDKKDIVIVKSFESKNEAMFYYKKITVSDETYKDVQKEELIPVVISTANYKILMQDKSVDKYMKFFVQHYLK
jgi:tetratricopeptide (TPR) repeat protein